MGIICLPKRRWWGAGRESKPTVDERQLINQSINQLGGEAISQRRSIRDRATPGGGVNFSGVFSPRLISLFPSLPRFPFIIYSVAIRSLDSPEDHCRHLQSFRSMLGFCRRSSP